MKNKSSYAPRAVYAGADWVTQGDEVGHYGGQCGILCASGGIADNNLTLSYGINVQPMQGPHAAPGDGLRRWIQWLKTNNPNSLYAPWQGSRIQSSWDDHGEVDSHAFDGPDIAIALALPPGKAVYRLSLYFFNKDGHAGGNRQRDFLVQIYPLARRVWSYVTPPPRSFPSFPRSRAAGEWMALAGQSRPLAQARVVHFWGGVYQRFILRGPGDCMVVIHRNYSLNAIISGFFLDRLAGKAPSKFADDPSVWLSGLPYGPPKAGMPFSAAGPLSAAGRLWHAARAGPWRPWQARWAELFAYRAACAAGASARLLERWRWRLDIWTPADRRRFNDAMARSYARLEARQARQAALFRAMAAAKAKHSKHFVWRGSWANPATQPVKSK